jgi:hypothetical protein
MAKWAHDVIVLVVAKEQIKVVVMAKIEVAFMEIQVPC